MRTLQLNYQKLQVVNQKALNICRCAILQRARWALDEYELERKDKLLWT